MLSKKMFLVLVLCCVFVVGTFSVMGTVEAAKWKKIDSGKFETEYPPAEYKNLVYYQAFTQGENKLYYETYFYPKNGSAKKLANRVTLTKNKNVITERSKDYFSNEIEINSIKTKLSVKKFYNKSIKKTIKLSSTPANKLAFDKQYFNVNNTLFNSSFKSSFKSYGIELHKNYIIAFIFNKNEEYCTFKLCKNDKKITYKEYNQKRKITLNETFKSTKTLTSIYQNKKNKLIKRIMEEKPDENVKGLKSKNFIINTVKNVYSNKETISSVYFDKDDYYDFVWHVGVLKESGIYIDVVVDAKTGKILSRAYIYGLN